MGYDSGKIYRLLCNDGHYYYGSTIVNLSRRLYSHKDSSKKMTSKLYNHINKIGWDNVKIELIENFPCENREQLRKKENEYIISTINDSLCLNTLKSHITDEERDKRCKNYYLENKSYILQRNENYYKIHEEEIKIKRHEKYLENKTEINIKNKTYQETHKEEIKQQRKQFYEKNKERLCKEKREKRASTNPDELKRKRKEYRDKNRERINQLKREGNRRKKLITDSPLSV